MTKRICSAASAADELCAARQRDDSGVGDRFANVALRFSRPQRLVETWNDLDEIDRGGAW